MTEVETSKLTYALERMHALIRHLENGEIEHAKGEAVNVKCKLREVLGRLGAVG